MDEDLGPPIPLRLIPTLLQIGCDDGSVKLFRVVPGGIQFEQNLDRRKGESGSAQHFSASFLWPSCPSW